MPVHLDRTGKHISNAHSDVAEGEQVVGFFGRSYWGESFDALVEFGILTAPKGVELPDAAYDMAELQNLDGGEECARLVSCLPMGHIKPTSTVLVPITR